MQNLLTLEDAARELSTLTGKPWATATLLDYCAQNRITLLAQTIIDAKDIDELLLKHPKAMTWFDAGTWETYADVPPEALWLLQRKGTATIRHPADGPRSWPVRELPVPVEKVIVPSETLARISKAEAVVTASDRSHIARRAFEPEHLEWMEKAQIRAREIIKRQHKKDLYPDQIAIADEIAKEFRTAGIFGADGKPLSGATIKRHALKGISSAQGKQLSTTIRRGK